MSSIALILGITGQDGSYLAKLLLKKGYQVIGMVSSQNDIGEQNIIDIKDQLILEEGDLLDQDSITRIIKKHQPNEIYNLAGITFVPTSWDKPELVHDVNSLGVLRVLEAIRDYSPQSKFFQASTSRMFGHNHEANSNGKEGEYPQTETTEYNPLEPYSISKLAAHLSVKIFREHFKLFACNGVLFNHESEHRGPEFVTKKITMAAAKIKLGHQKELLLGNLDAKQDWGYAPDYVHGMWQMLQQDEPDDYILATGQLHTVREICEIAFSKLGLDYQDYVKLDNQFYREIPDKQFYGNPSKAEQNLNWKRTVSFKQMIEKMVQFDIDTLTKQKTSN